MTQREFFTAIVNGTINPDIQAFATDAIRKLDERNAARASKPTKSQKANAPLMEEIRNFLADKKNVLAAEVAAHLDVTTQKASGLLKLLTPRTPPRNKIKGLQKCNPFFWNIFQTQRV